MQSDPWWSFAMAVNVFLVFFFGANPSSFRKYLWLYCLICFGAPFIPALALLLIKDESGARIYGDATVGSRNGALAKGTRHLLTKDSCGVGLGRRGTNFGSTLTTCLSGSASFSAQ